jgi:hypothetical protein
MEGVLPTERIRSFEQKKTIFFSEVTAKVLSSFRLHVREGLFKRNADGERDWGNVSEHCLVEAARAEEFAELLKFSPEMRKMLMNAAAVHDFHKKFETQYTKKNGKLWDSFEASDEIGKEKLQQANFPEDVIEVAGSVGHGSFSDMEKLVQKETFEEHDIARLVMHYIDDYTTGAEWTLPAFQIDGVWQNDLDRRIAKNKENVNYQILNEEGRARFGGRRTFEMQLEIGKKIEELLTTLINERSNILINPQDLPSLIDKRIRQKIENIS